ALAQSGPGVPLTLQIEITPHGDARITFEGSSVSYYLLEEADSIDGRFIPSQGALGVNAPMRLLVKNIVRPNERFFRIRQRLLSDPLDLDRDQIDDVWEIQHSAPPHLLNFLDPSDATNDPDGDGMTNLDEYRSAAALTYVSETSPSHGEKGVSVTREVILTLSRPLATDVVDPNQMFAEFAGRRLLTRVEQSSDHRRLTLFPLEDLPPGAHIRVTLRSEGLTDSLGRPLDLDHDGSAGGSAQLEFETFNGTALANTAVTGWVYASEPVQGTNPTNFVNRALAGVTITVDGQEETLRAVTDADGFFKLQPAPAGRFFVHIDGRTVTDTAAGIRWPEMAYYPFVGKAWEATPGRTDNLAGGTGKIFLPLIQSDALKTVSAVEDTIVQVSPSVIAANPAFAGVAVTVPANSLFADNGMRGGRVGVAPVPPDRLPGPLPNGLQLPLVITVQTDGPSNFDRPVPVCFPNLPDPVLGVPLAPGTQQALLSFDHDKGEWEVAGTMTVSADGKLICSDPGEGIRQPGWHGPGPIPLFPPPPPPDPNCFEKIETAPCANPSASRVAPASPPDAACETCGCDSDSEKARECFVAQLSAFLALLEAFQTIANSAFDQVQNGEECNSVDELCFWEEWYWIQKTLSDRIDVAALAFILGARGCLDCNGSMPADVETALNAFSGCREITVANYLHATDACSTKEPGIDQLKCLTSAEGQFITDLAHCYRLAHLRDFLPTEPDESSLSNTRAKLMFRTEHDSVAKASPLRVPLARILELTEEMLTVFIREPALSFQQIRGEIGRILQEVQQITGPDQVGFFRAVLQEKIREARVAPRVIADGNAPSNGVRYAAHILRPDGEFVLRGETATRGQYQLFIPRDGVLQTIEFYDVLTKRFGQIVPDQARVSGGALPRFTLRPLAENARDRDADGLADNVEFVLGTDFRQADSDGDGLTDGFEVERGTNPLDGLPAQAGIIASAPAAGTAVDVCVGDGFAVVAGGTAGVTVFDIADFLNPIRAAVIDTPGSGQAVACANGFAAIADGNSGLAIASISPPARAALRQQVNLGGNVVTVAAAGPFAFAGLTGGEVALLRLSDGAVLDFFQLAPTAVADLFVLGERLYAISGSGVHVMAIEGAALRTLGLLPEPKSSFTATPRRWLSGGGGGLYATAPTSSFVFDVSGNGLPVFLQRNLTRSSIVGPAQWHHLVPNGSGIAVHAANPDTAPAGDIELYDQKPDGTNSVFLTVIRTPGFANTLAINRGVAYVADGTAGLQVVNYLPFDSQGQPPTVTLRASFALDPPRADASSPVRVEAAVADDVQVSHVEFQVDATLTETDGSFPFETRFITPALTPTKSSFVVRARAFDTGGNSAWSNELVVTLQPDTTAPNVTRALPLRGGNQVIFVTAFFTEPVAAGSVVAGTSFRLTSAGADGTFGTADDQLVSNGSVVVSAPDRSASLSFAPALSDGSYRAEVTTGVTDLAGNALTSPYSWDFLVGPQAFWMGGFKGDPRVAENWSTGRVPGLDDIVVIDLPGDAPVTFDNRWKLRVRDLLTYDPITWSGSSNEVSGRWIAEARITLNFGELKVAEMTLTGSNVLRLQAGAVLAGATINGAVELALADLASDLKVNGTLQVLPTGFFNVFESATIDATEIRFPSVGQQTGTLRVAPGKTLTISANTLVRSGNGGINGRFSGNAAPGTLNFDGRLLVEGAGGRFGFNLDELHFRGRAEAGPQTRLEFFASISGGGTVHVLDGEVWLYGQLTPASLVVRKEGTGKVMLNG
ncbi:MAG: Ig-like domain-containing protein, partial [Verrucomicrobiales bacterium]|nr:Ig-like domain-containing protein [Verrucomicrobiales bacterium]